MSNEALKVGELPRKLTGVRDQYLSFEKPPAGALWMDRDLTCHGRGGHIRALRYDGPGNSPIG